MTAQPTGEFTPALETATSPSGPVGHIDGNWGFWCETWTNWHGGFADEATARAGCAEYARSL